MNALNLNPSVPSPSGSPAAASLPLLVTGREAAAMAGVSLDTWQRLTARGECPAPVRLGPRCTRWRRKELLAWIKAGCPDRQTWEARRRAEK